MLSQSVSWACGTTRGLCKAPVTIQPRVVHIFDQRPLYHAWLNMSASRGRLLRELSKLDRFIVPHAKVYCLCAQPVRIRSSDLLRIIEDIGTPIVLINVGDADPA